MFKSAHKGPTAVPFQDTEGFWQLHDSLNILLMVQNYMGRAKFENLSGRPVSGPIRHSFKTWPTEFFGEVLRILILEREKIYGCNRHLELSSPGKLLRRIRCGYL